MQPGDGLDPEGRARTSTLFPGLVSMSAVCPRCGVAKLAEAFYRDASKANGRRYVCRACDREMARERYRAKKGGTVRRYVQRHPEAA